MCVHGVCNEMFFYACSASMKGKKEFPRESKIIK